MTLYLLNFIPSVDYATTLHSFVNETPAATEETSLYCRHCLSDLSFAGVDTRLKFTIEPSLGKNGFQQVCIRSLLWT